MALADDPQAGIFDRVIDDTEIENAADAILRSREMASFNSKMKRKLKKLLIKHEVGLEPGERVRVGRFVMTGVAYEGGAFQVDYWQTVAPALSAVD